MTRFIKMRAAATVGIVLATGAFAQTATKAEPIEHQGSEEVV
jgi:hypothetical protein